MNNKNPLLSWGVNLVWTTGHNGEEVPEEIRKKIFRLVKKEMDNHRDGWMAIEN